VFSFKRGEATKAVPSWFFFNSFEKLNITSKKIFRI